MRLRIVLGVLLLSGLAYGQAGYGTTPSYVATPTFTTEGGNYSMPPGYKLYNPIIPYTYMIFDSTANVGGILWCTAPAGGTGYGGMDRYVGINNSGVISGYDKCQEESGGAGDKYGVYISADAKDCIITYDFSKDAATIVNVNAPTTDSNAATKKYVDDEVGGISETDPQVGTLTDTKWCVASATDIDCTTTDGTALDDVLEGADNALISGGWTFDPVDGGAPFTTTSDTMVLNLNAEMLSGHIDEDYVHAEGDFISGLAIGSEELQIMSYCAWGGGGDGACNGTSVNFAYNSSAFGEINWNSMLHDADNANGMLGAWRLTNDVTGNTGAGSSFMTLSFTESCAQAGCDGTERAERDVLDIDIPQTTGVATVTVSGVVVPTAIVIPHGAAPAATCTVGEIFLDTDETDDTACSSVADNSLCLCVAANTWVALENN